MHEAEQLIDDVRSGLKAGWTTEVIVAPPAPYLANLAGQCGPSLHLAAQQCSATGMGAYTGEYAAEMLASAGVKWVIIGHSERREGYGESNEAVRMKLHAALASGLRVLLCCGEKLEDREAGSHFTWVEGQLSHALEGMTSEQLKSIVIAYEPIWAIGTGKTASSEQAQEMHGFIRTWLASRFNAEAATGCRILYGGSCKPSNAAELFAQPDVNGGLIGGASLSADDFLAIVEAAEGVL